MKKILLSLCLVSCAAACAGTWTKYAGNPVLGNSRLGTCFDVNVVTDGPAPYTMYFSWRPKKAIALVRSSDAKTWTQEPEICLSADPTSGWEDNLNRSCTVFKDGEWHMWYTGQAKGGSKIGYAKSKDGIHFTRVRREPVLVPEHDFEKLSTMNPYVRWDATRKVWRMWYAAGETYEPNVLCYAESPDGLSWTKWAKNPMFVHGPAESWDRDRIGACEVHPLPDGRWAMFYIGYSDVDTARIGCAISADGVTDWKRIPQNPIVAPDLNTWDSSACYKPSLVRDVKNNRWLLWYNGRNGFPEYVGCAVHEGLDLEAPNGVVSDAASLLPEYVRRFNAKDEEHYTNAIPNAAAEKFLAENIPVFACPDKDIERTYYFRWWTFRKHLRHDLGCWTVTEFLPKVSWSGSGNTIVCPAGHHLREGRWLRDPKYITENAKFWLSDPRAGHRWVYSSWLFSGACAIAEVTGQDDLPVSLLDDAVKYYEGWERGFDKPVWGAKSPKARQGGDGKGGFLSIDNYEGTEISLGGHGYKPLLASAMWSEAHLISEVAKRAGRADLAAKFAAKAETNRRSILANCWNDEVKFFTTAPEEGRKGSVRELHGYAPWYFGMPTDGRAADWAQLADPQGFAARYGLTFPERRAPGFTIDYKGHECKWNGPSWPFATTVALTAYLNDLHAQGADSAARRENNFAFLMWQYAAQQKRTRPYKGDNWEVQPWIDENLHPDKPDWLSRTIILQTPSMAKNFPSERGKDYNHSAYCDLVISGLVGFVPNGAEGFTVDPLAPATWDYFTLERLRYRGHDVSIAWRRDRGGLMVKVDGREVARRATMGRLEVRFSALAPRQGRTVTVKNPLAVTRPAETVSVPWAQLGLRPDDAGVRVWDVATGVPVPFQNDVSNAALIFSTPLAAGETREFRVLSDRTLPQADLSPVCVSQYLPERMDDFAWENDRFGARAYGPVIMQPAPRGQKLVSSGVDIINKCVPYPVLRRWFVERRGEASYHKNHGEGMDNYKVGTSRGCGGLGLLGPEGWKYSINWAKTRVIQCGPVRTEFELVYAAWGGLGEETRRVTLDRGRYFAHFQPSFGQVAASGCRVGPGIDCSPARQHNGTIARDLAAGWIANFEPDGVDEKDSGSIATALILDPAEAPATTATDALGCEYLFPSAGRAAFGYWAGAAWSGAGLIRDSAAWHALVRDFARSLRAPVLVAVD